MDIISRAEARARNLSRYFTNKPCKRGHVAERYTISKDCLACKPARSQATKRWIENNKNRWRDYQREYHAWYDRERRLALAIQSAPDCEKAAIRDLYELARRVSQLTGQPFQIDHLKPISKGGHHSVANMVIMRADYNQRKHAKLIPQWIAFFGGSDV